LLVDRIFSRFDRPRVTTVPRSLKKTVTAQRQEKDVSKEDRS